MDSPTTSSHFSSASAPSTARLQFASSSTSPSRSLKTAATSSSKALDDTPSSDDVLECTTAGTSSFAASLESHLAGKGTRLSLAAHLGGKGSSGSRRKENRPLGSSSSPLCSSSSSKRRRAVAFSATPLGSLNASPKHSAFFHPYHSAQRPNRRISIYSDTASSSPPPASSSPSNRYRRVVSSTLPSPPPEQDDVTDDELESSQVLALLLTIDQQLLPSNSPPRSATVALPSPSLPQSPSRTGIRSILKKRGMDNIRLVKDAAEGSKRNSGRRKHALNWDECFREPSPYDEELVDGASDKKTNGASTNKQSGGITGTKGKGSAQQSSSASVALGVPAAGAGSTGGDDPNENNRPIASTSSAPSASAAPAPAPKDSGKILYNLSDLEPVRFASPLLTICASLNPVHIGEGYIRPLSSAGSSTSDQRRPLAELDALLGANTHFNAASSLLTPTTEDAPQPPVLPTLLTDLESAYSLLVRAIIRLPPTAEPEQVTTPLEPLQKCTEEVVRALERDLSNIISFPTWSRNSLLHLSSVPGSSTSSPASPPITSPSAERKGKGKQRVTLPEVHMRRLKDEVGVAQVAVKVLGAICRDGRIFALFAEDDLARLAKLALSIPNTPNLSPSISKDFYPFLAWLSSYLFARSAPSPANRTPPPEGPSDDFLRPLLPSVFTALSHTLRATDKLRVNLSESLPAVQALLARFPREALASGARKMWFRETVLGLWDTGKRGTGVRGKSLAVLGELARFLTNVEDEDAEAQRWREQVKDDISSDFLAVLTAPAPLAGTTIDGHPQTYMHVLGEQMDATLEAGPTGKVDETAYNALIVLLALLPALLGPRFRKLELKGIKPFVALFNKFSEQSSGYMRSLTGLLWAHVARAFLLVGSENRSGDLWIFRHDKKPFQVLTSIFDHRRKGDWSTRASSVADGGVEGLSPARKQKHRANAQALAHAVVSMLAGFSIALYSATSPPVLSPSAEINPLLSESKLEHFDFLFESLVTPQLTPITAAPFPLTPVIGWAALASILRPRQEADRVASLDSLVNPVLFDMSIVSTTSRQADRQELLVQRALRGSCQGENVPGWGSRWVVSRAEKVLTLLSSLLGNGDSEAGWDQDLVDNSIMPVWTSLLQSFEEVAATSSLPAEQVTTSVHVLVNWLASFLRAAPAGSVSSAVSASALAHRFAAELFDVLGARLVAYEPSEATGDSKPWHFLASVVLDPESSHSMPSSAGEAAAYSRAVLSILSAPLKVDDLEMVLSTVTKELLAPDAQSEVYSSFAIELAARWTSLLSRHDFKLDAESLSTLIRFIRVQDSSARWVDLGAAVNSAIFSSEAKELQQGLQDSSASPTAPSANMRLLITLVRASRDQPTVVQDGLIQLAQNGLQLLFLDPQEGYLRLAAELLEAASDSQLAQLYPVALEGLQPLAAITYEGLLAILPILTPINRAFAITEDVTDTQASAVISEAAFLSFAKFWEVTYDSHPEIAVPSELVDVIKVVKDLTSYLIGDSVGETQTQGTQSMRATRQEESWEEQTLAPRAGQRLRSSRPSTDPFSAETAQVDVSGRGYEADVSTGSPLKTTLDSVSTATEHMPPPPSPSLRGPVVEETNAVPPSPSIAEETPREVIALRARASYAESALLEQSAAGQDSSLGSSDKGSSRKRRASSPEMRQPTPSRKRRSPSIVSDSDTDLEEMVVVSHAPSSQGSVSRSNKRRASSSNVTAAEPASASTSSKRKMVEAYVNIPSRAKGSKSVAREERANKRSLSAPEEGSVKKRKKKSPKEEALIITKSQSSSSSSRSRSASPRARSSSASPDGSSSSGINSPRDSTGDDAVRHLLAMPVETVVRTAAKVGGSPRAAMNRLKELGEQAARYFEALRRATGSQ